MRIFPALFLVLLSILLVPSITTPIRAATPNQNLLYVSPSQQGPFAAGTSIAYQVKVANMDPFNGWDIQVATNPNVINPVSLSITPNTLQANYSLNPIELTNCVNGSGTGCDPSIGDGAGVVHSAVGVFGNDPNVPSVSGVLFSITFTVVNATGVAGVRIIKDDIASKTTTVVKHTTLNGIYGNAKLPVVDFSWSPASPSLGHPVTFISNSSDPNPGSSIAKYTWDFGDGNGPHVDSPANTTYVFSSGGAAVEFTCASGKQYVVQLTVTDNIGISNSQKHIVFTKGSPRHDLAIDSILVLPADAVYAGTRMSVKASVGNPGTGDEGSFNVSMFIDHKPLGNATFNSNLDGGALVCQHEKTFPFTWDTTGLAPGSYEIEAFVSPVTNTTTHQVLETNLQNDALVHIVRIIVPIGTSSIPFTLPESLGLLAALIVAIIIARLFLRQQQLKRRDFSTRLD